MWFSHATPTGSRRPPARSTTAVRKGRPEGPRRGWGRLGEGQGAPPGRAPDGWMVLMLSDTVTLSPPRTGYCRGSCPAVRAGLQQRRWHRDEWVDAGVARAFRHGESRSLPPPRDPTGGRCPRYRCSLPRLAGLPWSTVSYRPCRRQSTDRCPRGTRLLSPLAGPEPVGPDAPGFRPPLKTVSRVSKQGLTARPSPRRPTPLWLKGLSTPTCRVPCYRPSRFVRVPSAPSGRSPYIVPAVRIRSAGAFARTRARPAGRPARRPRAPTAGRRAAPTLPRARPRGR